MSVFASITPKQVSLNEFTDPAALATGLATALVSNGATTPTYGACFSMTNLNDRKCLIFVQNAAANGDDKTVTIKAGNGIQGVSDLARTDLGYGEYTLLCIDSGRFKNVSENATLKALSSADADSQVSAKGKVFITGTDANIKVAVLVVA